VTIVYLGLGSNVGDSKRHLEKAIKLLGAALKDIKMAPFYASKAVGYIDQPDFLNTVVSGRTDLEPLELLKKVKAIEKQVGRTPTFRWGPRQIDIDIIFYGDRVVNKKDLAIPHPRFRERDFVLRPLNDLNPSLTDPVSGHSVKELLAGLKPDQLSIVD